jgi:hypothetical protein
VPKGNVGCTLYDHPPAQLETPVQLGCRPAPRHPALGFPCLWPCRQVAGQHQNGSEGLWGTEKEVPSFLYAMHLGGNRVFLEETCLVAKPPLPFAVLKRRLERRCAALGIKVRPVPAQGDASTGSGMAAEAAGWAHQQGSSSSWATLIAFCGAMLELVMCGS